MKDRKHLLPLFLMSVGAGIIALPGREDGAGFPTVWDSISWDLVAAISGAVFLISVTVLAALLLWNKRK